MPARIPLSPRLCTLVALALSAAAATGQTPAIPDAPDRLDAQIRALQDEAARLARTARTLLNGMRALEVERDLRRAEARQAEAAVAESTERLAQVTDRLRRVEVERTEQLPGLKAQLVEIYKRGRLGYAPLLLNAGNARELGRAARVVGAMARLGRERIERHRQLVESVRQERTRLEGETRTLEQQRAAATRARAAAEQAVTAHARRMAEIDARRDLAAQYAGELQVARQALLAGLDRGASPPGAVPLAPFRGALDWPVDGRLSGRFGDASSRLGGSAGRNGIEIAAAEGRPVRAVHGGMVVHAAPFAGLGTLVILDHGADDYSLYGYLGSLTVKSGQVVQAGEQLGDVGLSPAGPPALYFELRIDGRSVDPVQWLQSR